MSSGLMSCVRENSPPMDNGVEQTSGPFSLPVSHSTSFSPNSRQTLAANNLPVEVDVSNAEATATPNTDNKRRRFQPFRNIRRLFRRRTISTSVQDKVEPNEHLKEYNDHKGTASATVRIIKNLDKQKYNKKPEKEEKAKPIASASSPSSPLTHQQLEEAYSSQSLPKSSCRDVSRNSLSRSIIKILDGSNDLLTLDTCDRCLNFPPLNSEEDVMYATTSRASGSQTLPVSFMMYQNSNTSNNFTLNPKNMPDLAATVIKKDSLTDLHNSSDNFKRNSSQESEPDSKTSGQPLSGSNNDAVDITDNQHSLIDERLLDSECSQEPLSQSHDSVFSESATASSLSSVLKAELADVLRKRRNRPDASDEDLGLPHSPASPRRLNETQSHQIHTLSNIDTNAENFEGLFCTSTANNSFNPQYESLTEERNKLATLTNARYSHRTAQIHVASENNNKRHTLSSSTFQEIADELDAPRLSHAGAKHKMALRQKKKAPSRLQRRTIDTTIPEVTENLVRIPATRAYFEDSKIKTRSLPASVEPSRVLESKESTPEQTYTDSAMLSGTTGAANLAQFYRKRTRDHLAAPLMESTQFPSFSVRTITTKAGQHTPAATENLMENTFLRTSRASNKDEDDFDSQAKKLHISSSSYDALNKTRKSSSEAYTEQKSGLATVLSNIKMMNNETKAAQNTPTKAKSGPEARQRYAPISLTLPDTETTAALSNCQNIIKEQREKERLKSTAMIKHIAAVQQSPREFNDLNFELRPRTVNLNSYKQKPYTSYEPDDQAPTRFMETNEQREAKSRKPVEKARSFRYATDANTAESGNNMPSLPDLSAKETANLYFAKTSPTHDKSVSLGFEINDNNLMRPTTSKPKITTHTSKSAMDLSSRVLVPPSSNSSNRDITEIEQNIDMIVKSSPIISVVERTVEINNGPVTSSKSTEDLTRAPKTKPNRLSLKMEPSEFTLNLMPIPLREKEQKLDKKDISVAPQRKSVPVYNAFKEEQEKPAKEAKRSMSHNDKIDSKMDLPEFLKIQLNPIDNANKANEYVVLAKNMKSAVKEASPTPSSSSNGTTTTSINSGSRSGSISPSVVHAKVIKRHDSNESIEIKEQTPAAELQSPAKVVEAINGEARAIVTSFLTRNQLKTATNSIPSTPTSPTTTTIPNTPKSYTPSTPDSSKPAIHNLRSLSLQERRRMFLNADQSKTEKKVEELRTERKKSISEEVLMRKEATKPTLSARVATVLKKPEVEPKIMQKSSLPKKPTSPTGPTVKSKLEVIKSVVEKKKERQDSVLKSPPLRKPNDVSETGFTSETKPRMQKAATTVATKQPATTATSEANETPAVVLRKKTAPSQLPIAERSHDNSPRKINSRNDVPELMKVFARRSLKVKDEDINSLNEKIQANNAARRTICGTAHGVDSDKENQSASTEKLNKLLQFGVNSEPEGDLENNNNFNTSKKCLTNATAEINNVKTFNNNNNNNGVSTPLSPTKVISPTAEHNKLNNNNNNNNTNNLYRCNSLFAYDQSSSKAKTENLDVNNGNTLQNGINKKSTAPVTTAPKGKFPAMQERSATMSEFKNINQRRAEWEQRAKGVKN